MSRPCLGVPRALVGGGESVAGGFPPLAPLRFGASPRRLLHLRAREGRGPRAGGALSASSARHETEREKEKLSSWGSGEGCRPRARGT